MAHAIIHLKHPDLDLESQSPVGFSWTTLFFGFILFAYRQDWILAWCSLFVTFVLGPVPNIILCWCYNRWYLNRKLRAGYQVLRVEDLK